MSIAQEVEEICRDILEEEGLIPGDIKLTFRKHCLTCKAELKVNVDYNDHANGYLAHSIHECITLLQERVEELEAKIEENQ